MSIAWYETNEGVPHCVDYHSQRPAGSTVPSVVVSTDNSPIPLDQAMRNAGFAGATVKDEPIMLEMDSLFGRDRLLPDLIADAAPRAPRHHSALAAHLSSTRNTLAPTGQLLYSVSLE